MPRPKRKDYLTNPPKIGRSIKPIDWKRVDELLCAGCIGTEIASVFHMHPETFYDRVRLEKGICFTEYQLQRACEGESMLRETQFLKALGKTDQGDNTMLIWLGKNRLKQVDKQPEEKAQETIGMIHSMISKLASTEGVNFKPYITQKDIEIESQSEPEAGTECSRE